MAMMPAQAEQQSGTFQSEQQSGTYQPGMVPGYILYAPIANGKFMFGFACPVHGLRQVAIGRLDDAVDIATFRMMDGVPRPHANEQVVCNVCGERLAAPVAGWGTDCVMVPEKVLADLRTLAAAEVA